MNKYIFRLLNEWKQHGKIIIAVDFDDTISPWGFKTIEDKEEFNKVINLLKNCHDTGAYIVIFSACDIERYKYIQEYCEDIELPIDAINKNPIDLPYGKNNKIFANIFIDDRAGLNESLVILETVLYLYRGYLQTNKQLTDIA